MQHSCMWKVEWGRRRRIKGLPGLKALVVWRRSSWWPRKHWWRKRWSTLVVGRRRNLRLGGKRRSWQRRERSLSWLLCCWRGAGLVEKVRPLLVTTLLRWKWLKRRRRERKERKNCRLGKKNKKGANFLLTLDPIFSSPRP